MNILTNILAVILVAFIFFGAGAATGISIMWFLIKDCFGESAGKIFRRYLKKISQKEYQ